MSETTTSKTMASREPGLPGAVLESAKTGQQAASDAVRQFVNTVDGAIRQRRDAVREDAAIHELRETIVDAALDLADQLVTTQYEFLRSVVRSADRALSEHGDQNT